MAFPATFPVRQDIVDGNDEWTYDVDILYRQRTIQDERVVTQCLHPDGERTRTTMIMRIWDRIPSDFTLLDDANAMLAAYNSGELDFIENSAQPMRWPTIWLPASSTLLIILEPTMYASTPRTRFSPILAIRKAFSLVIDRNYIVENVSQAGEVPADRICSIWCK